MLSSRLQAIFDEFLCKVKSLCEEVSATGEHINRSPHPPLLSRLSYNQDKISQIRKNSYGYQGERLRKCPSTLLETPSLLHRHDSQMKSESIKRKYSQKFAKRNSTIKNYKEQISHKKRKCELDECPRSEQRQRKTSVENKRRRSKDSLSFLKKKADYYNSRVRNMENSMRHRYLKHIESVSPTEWSNPIYERSLKNNDSIATSLIYASNSNY